jgi:DNA-binding GntR family transcriptional regulator
MAAANRAFHWAILRPTPRAERILTTLWDSSDVYRARWFALSDNVARGAQEHARALDAVEAGDAQSLVAVLAEHRAGAVPALRAQLGGATPPARSASAAAG